MEKRTWKEWCVRIVVLCVGLVIAHLGVTLFMLVNLGADPFNVLIQGLNYLTPFSHGITHMCVCFLIILVLLAVERSYVKIGTLVCMVLGGPIIDGFTFLLGSSVGSIQSFPVRIVIMAAACLILAFGMTMVIRSDAGTGPNDLVSVVLSAKIKKNFGVVRVLTDFSFVLIGSLLGGVFGIGTLVCAFLVGTAANLFMPFSSRIVKWTLRAAKIEE